MAITCSRDSAPVCAHIFSQSNWTLDCSLALWSSKHTANNGLASPKIFWEVIKHILNETNRWFQMEADEEQLSMRQSDHGNPLRCTLITLGFRQLGVPIWPLSQNKCSIQVGYFGFANTSAWHDLVSATGCYLQPLPTQLRSRGWH